MKKSKKLILRAIPVFMMLLVVVFANNVVFCSGGVSTDYPTGGTEITGITNLAGNIWSTATVIAQICAFIAIIFAGIRYMFASADQKADIKKQTIILVVGAALVFGAGIVVQIISNILNEVSGI